MVKSQDSVFMGCWNVRTMWEQQHEQEVIWDIKEKGIKICVVTEGHWVGNGERQVGDYFVLFSGHPPNCNLYMWTSMQRGEGT